MKILIVTTEWERFPGDLAGIHVRNQIAQLKKLGIQVHVFPVCGKKNPLNYWRARREFQKLDIGHYDVIHAHHGQSGVVALAQKKRPVVVTFHGSDLQGIQNSHGRVTLLGYILKLTSRWVASRADAVILVADHLANNIHKRPYHLIPAGIDLEIFRLIPMDEARLTLNLPADKKLILFIGDPQRTEKRFWLAQEAVKPFHEDTQLVTANGISPEKMPLYMNACNLLLITSSTEGSPSVVKEALACNLPIVSTDVGDVRQRIENIDGCQICTDDRIETISAALEQALNKNEKINGRASALEFDEKALAEKTIAVYQNLLSK